VPIELHDVTFETVSVDRCGQVVTRTPGQAQQFAEQLGNGVALELVAIPPGTFQMGSPEGQGYPDEHPRHAVRIAPFLMGKYPLTQAQWAEVMDWTPPYRCKGPQRPADRVTWDAAQAFCKALAKKAGRRYRLPSEAEWEHACRAGTTSPFYFGPTITTDLANYVGLHRYLDEPEGVYRHVTTNVGSFPPNPFGLYDMHGNVWEWCADAWHDDYRGAPTDGRAWEGPVGAARVLRGGCWHDPPNLLRSATRLKMAAHEGEDFLGFRVALDP